MENKLSKSRNQQKTPTNVGAGDDFELAYGEKFTDATNLSRWTLGEDLGKIFANVQEIIRKAQEEENETYRIIRKDILPKVGRKTRLKEAGWHKFDEATIDKGLKGFLFNGSVEACDGVFVVHNTLPLSITQIGICLVSYFGQQGSYVHRLYRRDLQLKGVNPPVEEVLDILDNKSGAKRTGKSSNSEFVKTTLFRRGYMALMERKFLIDQEYSKAPWKLGHGNPLPFELMTGVWASRKEMMESAFASMRSVVDHEKFVYVPGPVNINDWMYPLGNALRPYEYLIINTVEGDLIQNRLETGHYREFEKPFREFIHEIGSKVAVGLIKVSDIAPPCKFYGHLDHMQTAALIAMADSFLQLHKGAPMLLDLAEHLCNTAFGQNEFLPTIRQAYMDNKSINKLLI